MNKLAILLTFIAQSATAYTKVDTQKEFLTLIEGRTLSIWYYTLRIDVWADGQIEGRALGSPITGTWFWEDGYFCREMRWGDTEIPFNCQLVEHQNVRMRFTTDRGAGDSATFSLRARVQK